ncbi:MAG: LysR family transcriptional regulator [Acidimicrobiales bacterium]
MMSWSPPPRSPSGAVPDELGAAADSVPGSGLLALSTQQLEYLMAVASAPRWADAAARLGVTPSALSQGLAQLERRLGVPLFAREGRRRVLRPDAAPVLASSRRIVAETRDLARWAASMRLGEAGSVRVGMIDLAAVSLFGATLQRFRRSRPDVGLHLAVAPSAALLDQLAGGEIDLAVVVAPERPTGELSFEPLTRDELAVYAPDGGRAGDPASWGPWVTFPEGSHTRRLVARALGERGAPFAVVATSNQPEVLCEMVRLGMGWTVLPVAQAEAGANPLLPARPEPLVSRELVVATRHGHPPSATARLLVDELKADAGPGAPSGATGVGADDGRPHH